MGQITATRNLVATKVVRLAGQKQQKFGVPKCYLKTFHMKFVSWVPITTVVIIGSGKGLALNRWQASVGNSHQVHQSETLEEDQELFVDFSLIFCWWFEIQGKRTYNFFDWVSNTGDKPVSRPILAHVADAIWCYKATMSHINVCSGQYWTQMC